MKPEQAPGKGSAGPPRTVVGLMTSLAEDDPETRPARAEGVGAGVRVIISGSNIGWGVGDADKPP